MEPENTLLEKENMYKPPILGRVYILSWESKGTHPNATLPSKLCPNKAYLTDNSNLLGGIGGVGPSKFPWCLTRHEWHSTAPVCHP